MRLLALTKEKKFIQYLGRVEITLNDKGVSSI